MLLVVPALCGLSLVQWKRESELRGVVAGVHEQLRSEKEAKTKAEEGLKVLEQENARLTRLREDTETKLLEVTETLRRTQEDQLGRGTSIIVLTNEMLEAQARADALEGALRRAREQLVANDAVEPLALANERLKKLTAERDAAIREANERTRAYNELAAKYNRLVR